MKRGITKQLQQAMKVYLLKNPNTKEVFYVGITKLTLKQRLRGHYNNLYEARREKVAWNKRLIYLESLMPQKAEIELIEECTEDTVQEKEKFYIEYYSSTNNLTNQTKGGHGGDTFSMRDDQEKDSTRLLISVALKGIKRTEEFKKKLSDQRKGYNNPMSGVTKFQPVVLESKSEILIFKNGVECNGYFKNRHCWSNLCKLCRKELVYRSTGGLYKGNNISFSSNCRSEVKDIVQTLIEREGNGFRYNKRTKEVTVLNAR